MRKSHYILIIGMVILIAGAIMNLCKVEPYGDYVLIAGAIVIIARGFVRTHEKDNQNEE
jgi:hypothetical protein